jgi:hypothetical protein
MIALLVLVFSTAANAESIRASEVSVDSSKGTIITYVWDVEIEARGYTVCTAVLRIFDAHNNIVKEKQAMLFIDSPNGIESDREFIAVTSRESAQFKSTNTSLICN